MSFLKTIGNLAAGLFTGPKKVVENQIKSSGSVQQAAADIIKAGNTAKTIVTAAGAFGLGAAAAPLLAGGGGIGTITLPKLGALNLGNLSLKTVSKAVSRGVTGVQSLTTTVKGLSGSANTSGSSGVSQVKQDVITTAPAASPNTTAGMIKPTPASPNVEKSAANLIGSQSIKDFDPNDPLGTKKAAKTNMIISIVAAVVFIGGVLIAIFKGKRKRKR